MLTGLAYCLRSKKLYIFFPDKVKSYRLIDYTPNIKVIGL